MAARPLAPLVGSPSAILDANVLIAPFLRDVMLSLADAGLYRAHWTDEITSEWTRNALAKWPGATAVKLRRTVEVMRTHFPDACVHSYERHLPRVDRVDAKDRHVAAAALEVVGRVPAGSVTVIVTANLKDFPEPALADVGVVAADPDSFVLALLSFAPEVGVPALERHRTRLKHPPLTPVNYLDLLLRSGLVGTARALADGVHPNDDARDPADHDASTSAAQDRECDSTTGGAQAD
ncbi:MAG TPA: hypothetical protein VGD56_07060 [Gemmatirosa sp.]